MKCSQEATILLITFQKSIFVMRNCIWITIHLRHIESNQKKKSWFKAYTLHILEENFHSFIFTFTVFSEQFSLDTYTHNIFKLEKIQLNLDYVFKVLYIFFSCIVTDWCYSFLCGVATEAYSHFFCFAFEFFWNLQTLKSHWSFWLIINDNEKNK